ncbi:MAG: type II toxin-antitoxin system VapC family toxin [Scrofimicrobium sp.]
MAVPRVLIGIDTNVLLRFLLVDDEVQAHLATDFFASLTPQQPGFITHITLVETYWVLTRRQRASKRECLSVFRKLTESNSLEFEDGEAVIRALYLAEDGADFPDALIASSMDFFDVSRTVTFDRKASKTLGWSLLE